MAAGTRARLTLADVRRAAEAGTGTVRRTPVLDSGALSEIAGGTVVLKAENLQRTGSFKLRGALAKLAALGDAGAQGVVAGSAGNHAQAVALAARERGVACHVFMPRGAPVAKVEATAGLGAEVTIEGDTVDAAIAAATAHAAQTGLAYVHPYDDPDVVAGQGTLGIELAEQVGEKLRRVLIPVGGGGLASGAATALRELLPGVEVVGVRVEPSLALPGTRTRATIADGIAVKRPGAFTAPLLERLLDRTVTVAEDEIGEAIMWLLERSRLVVEGAGAVGVAALRAGRVAASPEGVTAVVLSGGNVDSGLIAELTRRHESLAGRRLVLLTRVPDTPGSLARLLGLVADGGANLLDVQHVREGVDLHVRETAVQLVLETRGPDHAEAVAAAIRAAGYDAPRLLR